MRVRYKYMLNDQEVTKKEYTARDEFSKALLVSTNKFEGATGDKFFVTVNPKQGQWFVINDATGLVALSGYLTGKEMRLSKDVRRALRSLGVQVQTDERAKRGPKNV